MHADTLRPPRASGCIKVSQCQFKTELTTATLAPEACSSARETRIRKAFVSFGHYLVHPPALIISGTSMNMPKFSQALL